MTVKVEKIKCEYSQAEGVFVNAFMITKGSKCVLVDTGFGEHFEKLKGLIGEKKLEYIIVTHAHCDHVGSCAALKKEFPDCTVILSEYENKKFVVGESSDLVPRTVGFREYLKNLKKFHEEQGKVYNKGKGDVVIVKDMELEEYGIKIIFTPGHTKGSISVICEGNLFCGDLLYPPIEDETKKFGFGRPGFLSREEDFRKSLKKIMEHKELISKIQNGHNDEVLKFEIFKEFCNENNIF